MQTEKFLEKISLSPYSLNNAETPKQGTTYFEACRLLIFLFLKYEICFYKL